MRRLLSIIFIFSCVFSFGQQRPHYTQYVINPFIINPAIAGIDNYTDLKLAIRDQWVGLKGAPNTSYFSIHGPIGKSDYRESSTGFAVPGENPRGKAYWENYTAAEPHHGMGLNLVNDRTGSFSFFNAAASYAYHIGLNPTTNLSGGLSAGITKVSVDATMHDFSGSGDPSDPATGSGFLTELTRIKPQMAAGLWLYSRNYFVGFSAQNVLPQTLNFVDDNSAVLTKGRFIPHLFLTAGYRFLVGDDLNVTPSVMVKYIQNSSFKQYQPEVNLKMQYRDQLWLGGSYRLDDGYSGYLGLNVSNTFNISYAYEKSANNNILRDFNRGTHEMVLGFILGNQYSGKCPRCY